MIVLIVTRGNDYTLRSLVKGTYGPPVPKFRMMHYEQLFGAAWVPRATFIFGDLERLAPWELRIAADLHQSMIDAGLRCLNNPATAMSRVEFSETMRRAGNNPYRVFRADAHPVPDRFPVFLRSENDHAKPAAALYHDQSQLDAALGALRKSGTPLRGMLVSELAAEPYSENLWAKWGTWRIGDRMVVEHIAVDDIWLVKTGDHKKVTDAIAADEHDAVARNRYASELKQAFDMASVEFGRADHAAFEGRQAVFEINTNPYSGPYVPDAREVRRQTQLTARANIAEALRSIDTERRGWVRLAPSPIRRPIRWWRPGFVTPRRP